MRRSRHDVRGGPVPPAAWLLWTSFLAAPLLWFGYFMLAYVFNEATCGAMGRAFGGLGVPIGSVLFIATVVVTLACAGAAVVAWRVGRRAARTKQVYDDFLPRAGYVMALLVTFVMVAHLFQIVMIGACA